MTSHATLLLVVLLAPAPAFGQSPAPDADKGTYLGALFSAVPEARNAKLPESSRGQGVLVTHVFPKSPAAAADLRRDDVLIQYNGTKIRDCEHFARLIRADRADNKVMLTFLRDGKEQNVEATLALGPVLQIAPVRRLAYRNAADVPRAIAKTGAPPAVSVACTPLTEGNVKLTIEYYPEGAARPRTVVCTGNADEIDREVGKLPVRVQELTRVALDRIRALGLQENSTTNNSPSAPKKP